ncbi:MAG: hypothetical protein HKN03_18930, partial [Acidimicrobiales bacterium]|nr:hypothetical protein [Acidimicrobiales bacterium]
MKRLQATWTDTLMSDRRYRIMLLLGLLFAFLLTWYFVYLVTNESAGPDGPLPFKEDSLI